MTTPPPCASTTKGSWHAWMGFSGCTLGAEARQQAALATGRGGLGLRSAADHSPAAYLASVTAALPHCQNLDPGYRADYALTAHALGRLNSALLPADRLPAPAPPNLRQQQLPHALDKATLARLAVPAPGREAARAHLQLLQQPGAGAWLNAPPAEALGLSVEPRLFRTMLQMRLRLPVFDNDGFCPL